MKKAILLMAVPFIILLLFVPGNSAVTAGRASLGTLAFEVPKGWEVSVEEKRITGKPIATGNTPSKEWYLPGSELFVILGPESDSGRELSATLKKFIKDTFPGYAEIERKSLDLKIQTGIENLAFSIRLRNSYSGEILYAIVMILRHKGSHYLFVYNIDREDLIKEFSKGALIEIAGSMRTSDESDNSSRKQP